MGLTHTNAESAGPQARSAISPERLRALPDKPGIYIFKNAKEQVLYVGKAVRLRSRVRSYFGKNPGRGPWIAKMVEDIAAIDTVVTSNEIEALILESNYIKKYKPKHNVILRDDKQYPYLKISTDEEWPRLSIVRRPGSDGASYMGPFPAAGGIRRTIRFMQKTFRIRACTGGLEDKSAQRCLYFQMGQCLGPCDGLQSHADYISSIRDAVDFLSGRSKNLIDRLQAEMKAHSDAMRFEAAAGIRDQIQSLERLTENQKIVSLKNIDQDVVGLNRESDRAFLRLLFIRGGRLLGDQHLSVAARGGMPDEEVLSSFVKQYYRDKVQLPDEILLPAEPADREVIADWLSDRRGRKCTVLTPRRGEKKRLVEMACENAGQDMETEDARIEKDQTTLEAMRAALEMEELPRRIEAFDVSNLHGSHIVGASVTFKEGRPLKDGYRRYKVRTVSGAADDFASMREIVSRRMERLVNEGKPLPDLLLIDGGKGQLSAAAAALEDVGVADVFLCAISKGKTADNPADHDVIFLPGRSAPVRMREGSPEKLLLQRIRDEVHRFVITFHRTQRTRGEIRSSLDDVPGLGPKKKRALLRTFGSLRGVLAAADEALLAVEGITPKIVHSFREHMGVSSEASEKAEAEN
ncbi:MAG: excinuclease ABC subunit UvrC [bacterium]|nr:excinuclease ABC subunit UvrC [bacterium]